MYVCTYQQIQDMLSLQCDCVVVTHQEESHCSNNKIDVYTVTMCIHVQLRLYHYTYMYLILYSSQAILQRC